MFRTVFIRGLILALALLVLGTPLAFAAGSRETEGPALRGVLSALWEALVELLPIVELDGTTGSGSGSGTGTTTGSGQGGPGMDPNGKPPTGP